jgi:hypothetical protein
MPFRPSTWAAAVWPIPKAPRWHIRDGGRLENPLPEDVVVRRMRAVVPVLSHNHTSDDKRPMRLPAGLATAAVACHAWIAIAQSSDANESPPAIGKTMASQQVAMIRIPDGDT